MSDELILTEENEDLFSTVRQTPQVSKLDDFDPPQLLSDEGIVAKTPVIKFMTPVRREKIRNIKNISEEDSEEKNRFLAPEPVPFSPVRSPKVDLTDDDDVNEHVRKLISFPGQQDYDDEPEKIQEVCFECFKSKFQTLTINYPEYDIEFPESKSLNKIHKYYHELIKSVYVNMNIGQYETWYIIGILAVELIAVQVFNLPMSGYTKSEMKRMYRYRSLLIELGESFYPTGTGEQSSIEWRMFSAMGWNIVTFLAVKVIADWVGGDDMVEVCRQVIEQLMDSHITTENIRRSKKY